MKVGTTTNPASRPHTVQRFREAILLGVFGLITAASSGPLAAQTFSTLYSFDPASVGHPPLPFGRMIQDSSGNLYGLTGAGYAITGSIYKLDSTGAETDLHRFDGSAQGGPEGGPPMGLVRDSSGNLYGTTVYGGTDGDGTLFMLDTSGNLTVLHNFTLADGGPPTEGLLLDAAGNIFGACFWGPTGDGAVFKLDTSHTLTTFHTGMYVSGALTEDAAGNLYGTSPNAGGYGSVIEFDPSGHAKVLHSFSGLDGISPIGGVILDGAGNLYGTTSGGGSYATPDGAGGIVGPGTVFKIDHSGAFSVLHNFSGGTDGANPDAALTLNATGDLYGTASQGGLTVSGTSSKGGTVFKIDASGVFSVVHSFTGTDGAYPLSTLLLDPAGNLYGTTAGGGTNRTGTVFKLTNTVPFSSFNAKLDITSGPPPGYQLKATFTQPAGAPAINVLTQGITLSIGPSYTLVLPGSAFTQTKAGTFVYQGPSLQVRISNGGVNSRTGTTSWQVQVEGQAVNLTGLTSPSVTLTLGNNTGTTTP